MTVATPPLNDNKRVLTNMRSDFLHKYSIAERQKLNALEKKFGEYIYLPFDVEPIRPNDPTRFAAWYREHSKPISKIRADVAGSPYSGANNFRSINSQDQHDLIWETNRRDDIFTVFPELKTGMEQLPFKKPGEFSMWSSMRPVMLHRDQGAWEDLPASFRIMLYDENPRETLFLRERPAKTYQNILPILPLRRTDSNVFGWSNLRTAHGSTWNPAYFKVLLIFTALWLDLDKFEDLLERSVAKYGSIAHRSQLRFNDFVYF